MHVDLGPILYADTPNDEKQKGEVWRSRVHLLVRGTSEEPPITVRAAETWATIGEPKLAHAFPSYDPDDGKPAGAYYWNWRVEAERAEAKRHWLTYYVESENGESKGSDGGGVPDVEGRSFGGGDQIYADKLWQREPLKRYKDLSFNEVKDETVEDGFEDAVRDL